LDKNRGLILDGIRQIILNSGTKDEVLDCMKCLKQLSVSVLLTDQSDLSNLPNTNRLTFHNTRLNQKMLSEFDRKDTVAYLCGPPKLSDQINGWLNRANIKYEKWW